MNPGSRGVVAMGCISLVLLCVGAGRVPYGSEIGLPLSLLGAAASLVTALSGRDRNASVLRRSVCAALAVVGVLILWAGTLATATAVAGIYYAKSHQTPYTGMAEVVMAGICAVVAPPMLMCGAGPRRKRSPGTTALLWGYWLAFYLFTMVAAALGQPWGSPR